MKVHREYASERAARPFDAAMSENKFSISDSVKMAKLSLNISSSHNLDMFDRRSHVQVDGEFRETLVNEVNCIANLAYDESGRQKTSVVL